MLRDPPHQAGVAEQVRADLALLEVGQEDLARQEAGLFRMLKCPRRR